MAKILVSQGIQNLTILHISPHFVADIKPKGFTYSGVEQPGVLVGPISDAAAALIDGKF